MARSSSRERSDDESVRKHTKKHDNKHKHSSSKSKRHKNNKSRSRSHSRSRSESRSGSRHRRSRRAKESRERTRKDKKSYHSHEKSGSARNRSRSRSYSRSKEKKASRADEGRPRSKDRASKYDNRQLSRRDISKSPDTGRKWRSKDEYREQGKRKPAKRSRRERSHSSSSSDSPDRRTGRRGNHHGDRRGRISDEGSSGDRQGSRLAANSSQISAAGDIQSVGSQLVPAATSGTLPMAPATDTLDAPVSSVFDTAMRRFLENDADLEDLSAAIEDYLGDAPPPPAPSEPDPSPPPPPPPRAPSPLSVSAPPTMDEAPASAPGSQRPAAPIRKKPLVWPAAAAAAAAAAADAAREETAAAAAAAGPAERRDGRPGNGKDSGERVAAKRLVADFVKQRSILKALWRQGHIGKEQVRSSAGAGATAISEGIVERLPRESERVEE